MRGSAKKTVKRTILFICTGNTCRSAMAQWLCDEMIREAGLIDRLEARSAGTGASDGSPMSVNTRALMQAHFGSVPPHKSRQLTAAMLKGDVLVVAMEHGHKNVALALGAEPANCFTLGELGGRPDADVLDPYGQGPDTYAATRAEIAQGLKAAWNALIIPR